MTLKLSLICPATTFPSLDNEGGVGGLTQALVKAYGRDIDTSCAAYMKDIEAFLHEALKNNQCFTAERLDVLGSTVVLLVVERSTKTNFLLQARQAYIRTGATNMKMAPQDIEAKASAQQLFSG